MSINVYSRVMNLHYLCRQLWAFWYPLRVLLVVRSDDAWTREIGRLIFFIPFEIWQIFSTFKATSQISHIIQIKARLYNATVIFADVFWENDSLTLDIYILKSTCNEFELESPILLRIRIFRFPQLVSKMGVIDLDRHGYLAISKQNSKKWRSTSVLYTDLCWPSGVTCLNLILSFQCKQRLRLHIEGQISRLCFYEWPSPLVISICTTFLSTPRFAI